MTKLLPQISEKYEYDSNLHTAEPELDTKPKIKNTKQTIQEPTFKYRDFSKGDAKTKLALHEPKKRAYKSPTKDVSDGGYNFLPTHHTFVEKQQSPRSEIYLAKFKRYLYNKHQKEKYEDERDKNKKREYDTWMYGPESSHKDAKKINWEGTDIYKKVRFNDNIDNEFDEDKLLIEGIKQQQSHLDSLSKQDQVVFHVLKWIFNAIRKEQDDIPKSELLSQLEMNQSMLSTFGFSDMLDFKTDLDTFPTKHNDKITWDEFIDFFISKSGMTKHNSEWWKTILNDMEEKEKTLQTIKEFQSPEQFAKRLKDESFKRSSEHKNKLNFDLKDEDEAKYKMVNDNRVDAAIMQNNIFNTHDDDQYDTAADDLDIFKNNPKCLLLDSHFALLQEIFQDMDKYDDYILIRSDFILAIREDERIYPFAHIPAVQLPKSRQTLTFDEVLKQIELEQQLYNQNRDAMLDPEIYDKKYITFREFSNYFKEFKYAEDRHKNERRKAGYVEPKMSEPLPQLKDTDEQRAVLDEVPRLREEDEIDADQQYIDLIMDIYDALPRVEGTEDVYKDEFFLTLRKDPQIRKILTTIAREPDGKSRIHRETFQEVFDRMEKYELQKTLPWSTIIEYFTKRGRPLTYEEKQELLNQDAEQDDQLEQEQIDKENEERNLLNRSEEKLEDPPDLGTNTFNYGGYRDRHDTLDSRQVRFEEEKYMPDQNFKDSLNDRDPNYGRESTLSNEKFDRNFTYNTRSRLSHSHDREDLTNMKLTTEDFLENQKLRKKRAHSSTKDFKVTVPRPFKFERRSKNRPKTIREWKVDQMIQEKQLEEELALRHFRASKPPPEVSIPQYKNIMEKEHLRRQEVKANAKQITKSKEKLFEFYKREQRKQELKDQIKKEEKVPKHKFKARNPPPEVVNEMMVDPQAEKYAREQRVKERAKNLMAQSKLPPNMSKNEDKMKKK